MNHSRYGQNISCVKAVKDDQKKADVLGQFGMGTQLVHVAQLKPGSSVHPTTIPLE